MLDLENKNDAKLIKDIKKLMSFDINDETSLVVIWLMLVQKI